MSGVPMRSAVCTTLYSQAAAFAVSLILGGCSHSSPERPIATVSSVDNSTVDKFDSIPRFGPRKSAVEEALAKNERALFQSVNDVLLHREESEYASARANLRQLLDEQERVLAPDAPTIAVTCDKLAKLARRAGDHVEEEKLARRALAIRTKYLGAKAPDTVSALRHVAEALQSQGRRDEAVLLLLEYTRLPNTGDSQLCSGEIGLTFAIGKLYSDSKDYAKAEQWLLRAARLKNERAHRTTFYPTELVAFLSLAEAELALKHLELAHNHFVQAANNRFAKFELDTAIVGGLIKLGDEYIKSHQSLESTECYSEAFEIGRKSKSVPADLVRVAYARMHLLNKPD